MLVSHPTPLTLYRWANPDTTCDYPYLALADDRSLLLSLGDDRLCFEWSVPEDADLWLEHDFAPTGRTLFCDFAAVRDLSDHIFPGGVQFGMVTFGDELRPERLGFSLSQQAMADEGPEYLFDAPGSFLRVYRQSCTVGEVSSAERALLAVCDAAIAKLMTDYGSLLIELPPPRYRKEVAVRWTKAPAKLVN